MASYYKDGMAETSSFKPSHGKTTTPIIVAGLQELLKIILSSGKVGKCSRREVDLVVVVLPDRYDELRGRFSYEGSWKEGEDGPEDFPIIRQYLLSADVRSYLSLLTPPDSPE